MSEGRDLFWTTRDGLRLHGCEYRPEADDGRAPVICLHGLTRNAREFGELAPWLAVQGRRVLALDMRGRGLSDRDPQARYTLPAYADDVVRLLDGEGIARALFVGTSMGGLVTMELAAGRPDLVAGAVVNDVGPVLGEAGLTRIAAYVGKPVRIETWDDAAGYVRWQNEAAFPHYRNDDWARMARRMFHEREEGVAPDYDPAIARPNVEGGIPREPWSAWRALVAAGPVLLLRGALSDLLEPGVAAKMAAGARSVTLVEVPGVGHAPMLDEPAAREAIARFLAEAG